MSSQRGGVEGVVSLLFQQRAIAVESVHHELQQALEVGLLFRHLGEHLKHGEDNFVRLVVQTLQEGAEELNARIVQDPHHLPSECVEQQKNPAKGFQPGGLPLRTHLSAQPTSGHHDSHLPIPPSLVSTALPPGDGEHSSNLKAFCCAVGPHTRHLLLVRLPRNLNARWGMGT